MGKKITHKELEAFYSNVDRVCEEIFGVGTIYIDFKVEPEEEEILLEK